MPNHVTTIVYSSNQELLDKLQTFDNIIPMPPEEEDNWYNWRNEQWGTKWDCYEYEAYDGYVRFNTAWNTPSPIINKLSKMYPNETIEVKYADEDIGHNLGHYYITDGKAEWVMTSEAPMLTCRKFALEVKGWDDDEYSEM